MSSGVFIDAAKAARIASDNLGETSLVEIVITELGFVVRGWQTSDLGKTLYHSAELYWQDYVGNPKALVQCVRLVADFLGLPTE